MKNDRESLFCAAPIPVVNIDGGRAIAVLPSQNRVLSALHTGVLRMCAGCAPLHLHAKSVACRCRVSLSRAYQLLEELRLIGLFVNISSLTAEYSFNKEVLISNTHLTQIAIFTCNRVEAVNECIRTYVENLLCFSHESATITVWDDSLDPASRSKVQECLKTQAHGSIKLVYVGLEGRKRFARRLSRHGIPYHVCEFALLPNPEVRSIGANRNAAILDNIDRLCLFVDDDTRGVSAVHPDRQLGLALGGHKDPRRLRFFKNREAVIESTYWSREVDILDSHDQLLGRTLGDCIGTTNRRLQFLDPCMHLLKAAHCANDYTVAITMPGKIGDCGRNFGLWLVDSLERVMNWEDSIDTDGKVTREILEVTPQNAIVHTFGCMATALGIDGRSVLPPFTPQFRNQDGVFGALVARALPNALIGIPNYAVFHAAETTRHYETSICSRFSEILIAIINARPSDSPCGYSNLRLIGQYLVELSKQSSSEVQAQCRQLLTFYYAHFLEQISMRRMACRNLPTSVSKHVERELISIETLLADQKRYCPIEFSRYENSAWTRFATELGRLGELLIWWEPLHEATRDLRRKGITISME